MCRHLSLVQDTYDEGGSKIPVLMGSTEDGEKVTN